MRNLMRNRKIARYAFAVAVLFAATCNLKLGDSPIGPPIINPQQRDTTVTLSVSASRSPLLADGRDTATITAVLLDLESHAMVGETVTFSCDIITATIGSSAIVDSTGRARVTLTSAIVNDTCRVMAVAPRYHDTAYVTVVFSGVHISLQSDLSSQKVNDSVLITGQLLDGSNNPVNRGDSMTFTTPTGRFQNNGTTYRAQLDGSGKAIVHMTSLMVGTVMVYAASVGLRDSIVITFDSTFVPVVGARHFHLSSSKTQLKADNSDEATITATVVDSINNPAIGDSIVFSCTPFGIIGAYAIVDSNGDAKVRLRAVPVNGTCIVKARDTKTGDTASTAVIFSGITLTLEADMANLNIRENATVTAILKDGSGNPIGGDIVAFSTKQPGKFSNNATTATSVLDPTGRARVIVTCDSACRIAVYASCLNAGDTMTLFYTNNAITLQVSKDTLLVGGADSTLLTATYLSGSGAAVPNAWVVFYANAGTITRDSVRTDTLGKATTWLKSASFTATATVEASTAVGNALATVAFAAARIKNIRLTITPDNISINGGVATLTAMVWDINDNLVNLANVNFRILKGPGGGEYIDKPMATTQNGRTTAQLHAGSVPSMYRGVLVTASVGDTADTSKLTISGEPYAISVSHPQEDTVVVTKAGQLNETTFDYFVGAVVCDINGNPVADGTRVNFSAVVSGLAVHDKYFIRWAGVGSSSEVKAVYGYYIRDVPFEDINNNYRMDENDLKLDYNDAVASRGDDVNGDGRCDFNQAVHDLWFDFNNNGRVDTGFTLIPIIDTTPVTVSRLDTNCFDSLVHCIINPPDTIRGTRLDTICRNYLKIDTIGLDTICYDSIMRKVTDTTRPDTVWKDTQVTVCREVLILDTNPAVRCYDTLIDTMAIIPPDTLWMDSIVHVCRVGFTLDTTGWHYDTAYDYVFVGNEPYITVNNVIIWADLYPDGVWNSSELIRDVNGNGRFDLPASGDRLWWEYECLPYWFDQRFDFANNDFGIAVTTSATTTAGVASAKLTYPRQLARRLIVSVNVESNGVRDRAGARFVLPVIVQ